MAPQPGCKPRTPNETTIKWDIGVWLCSNVVPVGGGHSSWWKIRDSKPKTRSNLFLIHFLTSILFTTWFIIHHCKHHVLWFKWLRYWIFFCHFFNKYYKNIFFLSKFCENYAPLPHVVVVSLSRKNPLEIHTFFIFHFSHTNFPMGSDLCWFSDWFG